MFKIGGTAEVKDARKALLRSVEYGNEFNLFRSWLEDIGYQIDRAEKFWSLLQQWRLDSTVGAYLAANHAEIEWQAAVNESISQIRDAVEDAILALEARAGPVHSPLGQGWDLDMPRLDVLGPDAEPNVFLKTGA